MDDTQRITDLVARIVGGLDDELGDQIPQDRLEAIIRKAIHPVRGELASVGLGDDKVVIHASDWIEVEGKGLMICGARYAQLVKDAQTLYQVKKEHPEAFMPSARLQDA